MTLGQTVKAEQQMIVILLQVRPGTCHQCVKVFGLIVKRLHDGELNGQLCGFNHPLGFFNHRGHRAVGKLGIQRRQRDLLNTLRGQTLEYGFN